MSDRYEDAGRGSGAPASDLPSAKEGGIGMSEAGDVIQRFGGIRPMAQKLGIAVSTVQGWKERGIIPSNRRGEILDAARRLGIALELEAFGPAQGEAGEPSAPTHETQAPPIPPAEPASAEPSPSPSVATEPPGSEPISPQRASFEPAPPPAAARRGGGISGSLVGAALVALIVSGLVAGTAPRWRPLIGLEPQADKAGLADLNARLGDVEDKLAAFAKLAGNNDAGTSDLAKRVDGLASALDALKASAAAASAGGTGGTGAAVPDADTQNRIAGLTDTVTTLAKRLDELAAREATQPAPETVAALQAQSQALAARVDQVQALAQPLGSLPDRMAALDAATKNQVAGLAQRVALPLAIDRLRLAVDAGQPYADPLKALRAALGGDAKLAALTAPLDGDAAHGVPSLADLAASFETTQLAIGRTYEPGPDAGLFDRIVARLKSLVTVRSINGEGADESPDARAARAADRLKAGDLAGAIAALEPLQGAYGEAARPWLERARAKRAADAALDGLESGAIDQLVSGTAP